MINAVRSSNRLSLDSGPAVKSKGMQHNYSNLSIKPEHHMPKNLSLKSIKMVNSRMSALPTNVSQTEDFDLQQQAIN